MNLHVGSVLIHTAAIFGKTPVVGTQLKAYSIACTTIHTQVNTESPTHSLLILRLGKMR